MCEMDLHVAIGVYRCFTMEACLCVHQQQISGTKSSERNNQEKDSDRKMVFLIRMLSFQVVVKLKRKHVGGAFSKKKKCNASAQILCSVYSTMASFDREEED